MALSSLLALNLDVQAALQAQLPALVAEVNAAIRPDIVVVMPANIDLGIHVDMLKRHLPAIPAAPLATELPAFGVGLYVRQAHPLGEQDFSLVIIPCAMDIWLGHADFNVLYITAQKWAMVMDLWYERYASLVLPGFTAEEAPDIDISYTIQERDSTYRQLVSVTGTFAAME